MTGRSDLPPPSTERLDLSVNVTDACEELDRKVAHPPMRLNDDAERVVLAYVVALELANATIGANGDCVRDLRQRYAAAAAGKDQK